MYSTEAAGRLHHITCETIDSCHIERQVSIVSYTTTQTQALLQQMTVYVSPVAFHRWCKRHQIGHGQSDIASYGRWVCSGSCLTPHYIVYSLLSMVALIELAVSIARRVILLVINCMYAYVRFTFCKMGSKKDGSRQDNTETDENDSKKRPGKKEKSKKSRRRSV